MTYLKQILIGCLILLIPYLLLLSFGAIPSLHPKRLISKFTFNDKTINFKWFWKSLAVNINSSTNQNQVLFYKSSTNQSQAININSSYNQNQVLFYKSSTNQSQAINIDSPTNQSQAINIHSSTNQNHVRFYKFSTNQNQAAHFKSSTDKNKVSNPTLLRTNIKVKVKIKHTPIVRKKYLIYHCTGGVCGGLGDRQKGIISVFLLANVTKRTFGLILSKPCDIRQYLYPNEIQWEIPHKEYAKLTKESFTLMKRKDLNIIETADFNKLFKADVILLKTNYILFDLIKRNKNYKSQLKWLINVTYSQYFAESYRKIFKPSDIIARKLEEIVKTSNLTKDTKLICAHIRIGRNPSIPNDDPRNSRTSVKVVWDFLHRYNDTRLYKIFVATDSESVRKEAQHLFANQTVMNPSGKIIHIDFTRKASLSVCQGMEKVLLDQYVLMHCDVLVHSRSGFSENAAHLMRDKREIYVFKGGVILPSYIV